MFERSFSDKLKENRTILQRGHIKQQVFTKCRPRQRWYKYCFRVYMMSELPRYIFRCVFGSILPDISLVSSSSTKSSKLCLG